MKPFQRSIYNHNSIPQTSTLKITNLEDYLKSLYLNAYNSFSYLPESQSAHEMSDTLSHLIQHHFHIEFPFSNHLMEDYFIRMGSDISVSRHPRYLPPLPHTHSFFEIVCVLSGSCEHSIGSQHQVLETGDILIMSPGTMHTISATCDESLVINILIRSSTFDSTFLNTFADHSVLSDFFQKTVYHDNQYAYLLFHTGRDEELFHLLDCLFEEECFEKKYKNIIKNQYASLFFSFLLRNHEKDVFIPNPTGKNDENNFIFLLKYLENNYQTATLKRVAEFFHYSERHLIRLIKEYTGMSFSQNIQQIRLTHAATILTKSGISISDIASHVGYSNVSHFSKLFAEKYGVSPKEYRNCINKK